MSFKKTRIIVLSMSLTIFTVVLVSMFFIIKAKFHEIEFLTDASWVRYDDNIGENINISFHENGEYFYNCDCGEPVGDSDIYDSYSYEPENYIITLSGPDGETSKIEVLYYDDNYLCLLFEEGTVTFKNEKASIDDEILSSAREYVGEEGKPFLSVLGFENGMVTLAPHNYDKDAADSFAEHIFEVKGSEDISFSSVSITIEGDKEAIEFIKLTEDDYTNIGEFYNVGYIEFNNKGEVGSVVFYGTTEINR
ncbi:hypothetical protein ACPWSR_14375 [Alloiococcus sp. CFN-8]|uniref:hypothetical protein n=1 Tax=Alloiococcus sp. CFN-8 TaxID=3416081 RepID=UPI003CFB450F